MTDQLGPRPKPQGAWSSGLTAPIALRDKAKRRAPTDADRPSPTTLPMTPAARAALELGGGTGNGRLFRPRRRSAG